MYFVENIYTFFELAFGVPCLLPQDVPLVHLIFQNLGSFLRGQIFFDLGDLSQKLSDHFVAAWSAVGGHNLTLNVNELLAKALLYSQPTRV